MSYGWFPKLNAQGDIVSTGLGKIFARGRVQCPGFGPGWYDEVGTIIYGAEGGPNGETRIRNVDSGHDALLVTFAYNTLQSLPSNSRWVGTRPGLIHVYLGNQRQREIPGGRAAISENRLAYTSIDNMRLTIDGEFIVNAPIMDLALTDHHVGWVEATSMYGRAAYVDGARISFDETEGAIWLSGGWVMTQYSGGYKIRRIGANEGIRFRTDNAYFPTFRFIDGPNPMILFVASTSTGELVTKWFDAQIREDLTQPDLPPHQDAPHVDHSDTPPHSDHADHSDTPHGDHADQPHSDEPPPPQLARVAAFGPTPACPDMLRLFTEPEVWEGCRPRTTVFHFYLMHLIDFTDRMGPNSYDNLVAAGAFRDLKEWGILTELETDGAWEDTVKASDRMVAAGGDPLAFVVHDKVFHEIDPDDFANRVRQTRLILPHLKGIGVFAPFPFKSPEEIRQRLVEFDARGVRPDFLRLDIDPNPSQRSQFTSAVFQKFREMCDDRQIALQLVVNAPDAVNDATYITEAKRWLDHALTLGKWDGVMVQSWGQKNGQFTLPHAVPESDPSAHTNLLAYTIERLS